MKRRFLPGEWATIGKVAFAMTFALAALSCAAARAASRPQGEIDFVNLATSLYAQLDRETNPLARRRLAIEAAHKICSILPTVKVEDWIGEVSEIYGDAYAVLRVSIGPDMNMGTLNYLALDQTFNFNTMPRQGTPVYEAASTLHVGDTVRFSGNIIVGKDCDSMVVHHFIFRFESIHKL